MPETKVFQIQVTPPANPAQPPPIATATAVHLLNDLVVVSFGHPNLFDVEGAAAGPLKAPTFAQVGFSRSGFSGFLQNALTIIGQLPDADRDSFGWKQLEEIVCKKKATK